MVLACMQLMNNEVSASSTRTLREKTAVARLSILSQKPPIAEVVVAFYKLDAVAAGQGELVGAPSLELICSSSQRIGVGMGRGQRAALTHDKQQIARADVLSLRPGGHGHGGSQETECVWRDGALGRRDVHRGAW
jgi:hypothetical protein